MHRSSPSLPYGLSALGVPDSAFIIGRGPLFMISSDHSGYRNHICDVVGRKITDKGIGNGISLLIMVGSLLTFPYLLHKNWCLE